MDFNNIQNAWDSDTNDEVKLPTHLDKIKTANTPLDKIKKNLKSDLLMQAIAMIIIGFLPKIKNFPQEMITPFYLLYGIAVAVSIYYLVKLFMFYLRLNKTSLNTKDNLYETYYDIRLNMELYKTFTIALLPFAVMAVMGAAFYEISKFNIHVLSNIDSTLLIALTFIIGGTLLFIGFLTELWVYYLYGKFAKEIRKVIDELKEE